MSASLHVKWSNILIMDRKPESLGMLSRLLQDAGHQTFEATDMAETLSCISARPVDLVMLSLSPNETVDTDFTRAARDASPVPYLPVIVLFDQTHADRASEYLDIGADDVICIDTEQSEIMARVRSLLRIKDLHAQLEASHVALQRALDRERRLMAKLRADNAQLHHLATTDSLTRVQNVRSFRDILKHEYKAAKRYNYPLSVLMIDADHFKVINDTHGHPSGDYVLKELAVIFKQSVRESDVVARTGGEEFSIILPRANRQQVADFAERIRSDAFNREFIVYGCNIHATVSIGSATYPLDAEVTNEQMLAYFADQALLDAKESGRDRVVAFHELPTEMRQRLHGQHLRMCYEQPFEIETAEELEPVVADIGGDI